MKHERNCTGLRSTNALNINSFHLPTKFSQPANLTIPTQSHLCPVSRQNPFLICCHPSSTTRIFVITNHQPLLQIWITSPVESTPFFIPSTSLCSLSSWFTSSYAYHLITVITFFLSSHHLSLPRPFTPDLKLISFTNPFLHSHSYSFRTAFTDLNLY